MANILVLRNMLENLLQNDLEDLPGDSPSFTCGFCYTRFVSAQIVSLDFLHQTILFVEPYFNLDSQPQQRHGTALIAILQCRGCNTEMGRKYIREDNPARADLEGKVVLNMVSLGFWNGEDIFSVMVSSPMPPQLPPHQHDPPFFLCAGCNAHCAWSQELYHTDFEKMRLFFLNTTGLWVDPPQLLYVHSNASSVVAYVRCEGCNEALGMQIVHEVEPQYFFRMGMIALDMSKLRIWTGTGEDVYSFMVRMPVLKRVSVLEQNA